MDIHPCLRTYDILFLIFQECFLHRTDPVDEDSKPTIRTICSVIRTCKAFHGPAADLLWRHQSSLLPLIKCLPSDLWEDRLGKDRRLTFKRKVVPADFKRLDIYGPRILYLSCTNSWVAIDWKSMCSLTSCRPSKLLPNLRQFKSEYAPLMRVYPLVVGTLGPKLEVLTLELQPSELIYSFLRLLSSTCLGLKEMSLSYSHTDVSSIQVLSGVVSALPELEKISADDLLPHALVYLAQSLKLQALRIRNPHVEALQSITKPIFVNLHELELVTVISCANFTKFIQLLDPCHLRKLCMTLKPPASSSPSLKSWLECFSIVAKCCTPTSLEHLHVDTSLNRIDTSFFSIPLTFHNLKHVRITAKFNFGLSDDFIESMVLAWPKLEVLSLEANYTGVDEPHMTAKALIHLLQGSPSLQELSLPIINFDKRPRQRFDLYDQEVGPRNHAITSLGVGNSPVCREETREIGYFLLDLLPNLKSIRSFPCADADTGIYMLNCWNYIGRSLEKYKKERQGGFVDWETESNGEPEF